MARMVSMDAMWKDHFPAPGQPVKPYVQRLRNARRELEETGLRVTVPPHTDNCGAPCRNVGGATLAYDMRRHDCCGWCNDHGEGLGDDGREFEAALFAAMKEGCGL